MFNLIVTGGLATDRKGSILASRVFEFTSEEMLGFVESRGALNKERLFNIPTLFMEEGIADEEVKIGWLTKLEQSGSEFQFRFNTDPELPKFTNADICSLAGELEIDRYEFTRNHWAVKDVDLFQVLYRDALKNRIQPSVFSLSDQSVDESLISIMMPFSGAFDRVYTTLKTKVEGAGLGLEMRRADDFWKHPNIMQDIIELICTSSVVICDLSEKNPNVFYEAGIAHTLGKEVILIAQSIDDVPFDLRALRFIRYLNNQEGCDDLAAKVLDRIHTILVN